jgi:hypothetical protein
MALNQTLGQLISDVRAEAGHSLQANLGVAMRDVIINILQRQQRRLWEDYDWPFLRVKENVVAAATQRYYDIPPNLTVERLELVEFNYAQQWQKMFYGIGGRELNTYDSDNGVTGWPLEHWDTYGDDQFEVWPVPANNGSLSPLEGVVRFTGIRNLRPLVAESDVADLDDTLLVLFTAAEILAREKSADAALKLQMAEKHYTRLKNRDAKGETFSMAGNVRGRQPRGPKLIATQYVALP